MSPPIVRIEPFFKIRDLLKTPILLEAELDDNDFRFFTLRPEIHLPNWTDAVDNSKRFSLHLVAHPYSSVWESHVVIRVEIRKEEPWIGLCYLESLYEAEIK